MISVGMLAVGQLTESGLGFLFSFPDNDGRGGLISSVLKR